MEEKMEKELQQREIENKAREFLDEYRMLCVKYGMEFSTKPPEFVIIEKSYEKEPIQNNT